MCVSFYLGVVTHELIYGFISRLGTQIRIHITNANLNTDLYHECEFGYVQIKNVIINANSKHKFNCKSKFESCMQMQV